MEDIRYKDISKVVGIDDNTLLKVSLEIQTNHIKMKVFKIEPYTIEDFVTKINKIDFFDKLSVLRKKYSLEFSYTEDELRYLYLDYIKDEYIAFKEESDLKESQELFSNLDKYEGKSMPIVKWLATFSNEILDKSIMEFAPSIVSKIEPLDSESIKRINSLDSYDNINQFVVYMGNMKKYRGCIGCIEKTRDNEEASSLVCFHGKGKDKKSQGKLWCSNDNLLVII